MNDTDGAQRHDHTIGQQGGTKQPPPPWPKTPPWWGWVIIVLQAVTIFMLFTAD